MLVPSSSFRISPVTKRVLGWRVVVPRLGVATKASLQATAHSGTAKEWKCISPPSAYANDPKTAEEDLASTLCASFVRSTDQSEFRT